jgi:hypothetical protein
MGSEGDAFGLGMGWHGLVWVGYGSFMGWHGLACVGIGWYVRYLGTSLRRPLGKAEARASILKECRGNALRHQLCKRRLGRGEAQEHARVIC